MAGGHAFHIGLNVRVGCTEVTGCAAARNSDDRTVINDLDYRRLSIWLEIGCNDDGRHDDMGNDLRLGVDAEHDGEA